MKSALKPAIDDIQKALEGLETVLDKRLVKEKKTRETAPQLALARNESEVSRKIAAKLDQTIHRLESLLSEDA